LPLEQLGIKVYSHDVESLQRFGLDAVPSWTFGAVLKEGHFDLAILFQWFWNLVSVPEDYLAAIRRWSPQTRVAVLTYDLHGERERRLAGLSGRWTDLERALDFERREFEAYREADLVLPISEADRQAMLAAAPELETEILPMVAEGAPSGPEFARRADVLFLCNFDNAGNREGLDWLLKEIWPRVAGSLPHVQLHLAGNGLPENLSGERVVALGYVKDLDATFAQHRVFVAPIRICTGIQTKVLAALARGVPAVATPDAADGLNLQNDEQVLVASTSEQFADQIIRLYCDQQLWQKLSRDGVEFVKNQFSRQRLATQIRRVTDRVRELKPKPFDASHAWSVLKVEREFPEVLSGHAPERLQLRIQAYCALAEFLLAEGNPAAALEQLRHIFAFLQGGKRCDALFARILLNLDVCYRKLGSPKTPTDFVAEARECLASA
jgi:glycosyltransferase involved in cell wall biosynthesis